MNSQELLARITCLNIGGGLKRGEIIVAVALAVTFILLLSVPSRAVAGSWVLDHFNLNGGDPTFTWPSQWYIDAADDYDDGTNEWQDYCLNGIGSIPTGGTVQAVFYWRPSTNETPALPATFLVYAEADANDEECLTADWSWYIATPTANDGFGDTNGNDYYDASSIGSHLLPAVVTNVGGVYWATVSPPAISALGGSAQRDPFSTNVVEIFTPDSRAVAITTSNNCKAPLVDQFNNPIDDLYGNPEYTAATDAPGTADVGLPTGEPVQALNRSWTVVFGGPESYTGELLGSWSAASQDAWNSSNTGQTQQDPEDSVLPFKVSYAGTATSTAGAPDPIGHDTVILTCTDPRDGAVGSSTLAVTLHSNMVATPLPYGPYINNPDGPGATDVQDFPASWSGGSQPGAWNGNGDVTVSCAPAFYGDISTAGVGLTDVGTITSAFPASAEVGAALVALGLGATTIGSEEQDTNDNVPLSSLYPGNPGAFNKCAWGSAGPVPDASYGYGNTNYTLTCVPWVEKKYDNYLTEVDNWGPTGYVREDEKIVGEKTNEVWIYGVWTWSINPNGPGH